MTRHQTAGSLRYIRWARWICIPVFLTLLAGCAGTEYKQPSIDLMVINARILTVDEQFSIAKAMAVHDGRVVAIGDATLVDGYTPQRLLDLKGATVTPGFNDSHSHIQSYAKHYVALEGVDSIAALQAAVAQKVEQLDAGSWITGYGWSEDELVEGRRPLREDLDAIAPDHPVLLTRAGGHSAVANSQALARAKITPSTPQPDGGVIEIGADGRLNGIIRERQDLIAKLIPELTDAEIQESLTASLKALLPLGITSVTQASDQIDRWPIWRSIYLREGSRLPRVSVQTHWRGIEAMAAFKATAETNLDTARLRLGPIKIFVDGGFTGPAAFTKAPYRGEATYRGSLNIAEDELRTLIDEVHRSGWQMGIHAIGDAAIELTVDALANAIDAAPRANHRHYLNHFSMRPSDATMKTMAQRGIAITQQPNFTYTLAGRYATYLDGWRLQHNNPLRGPMDHGVFVALSSDILPIGPMVGLYAATTRRGADGQTYGADEAISMAEAITGYTHGGAWLSFEDSDKGRLVPGQFADFVVLSDDPLSVEPEAILSIQVEQTWIAGQRVWSRAEQ